MSPLSHREWSAGRAVSGSPGNGRPPSLSSSTSRRSATTDRAAPAPSSLPRTTSAGAEATAARWWAHSPGEQMTLTTPVSSSRLMNTVPPAVDGRWRWVTIARHEHLAGRVASTSEAAGPRRVRRAIPAAARGGGCRWTRPSPRCRRLAESTSLISASLGATAPGTIPGNRSGRPPASAPAAHSADRREVVAPDRSDPVERAEAGEGVRRRQRLELRICSDRPDARDHRCSYTAPRRRSAPRARHRSRAPGRGRGAPPSCRRGAGSSTSVAATALSFTSGRSVVTP